MAGGQFRGGQFGLEYLPTIRLAKWVRQFCLLTITLHCQLGAARCHERTYFLGVIQSADGYRGTGNFFPLSRPFPFVMQKLSLSMVIWSGPILPRHLIGIVAIDSWAGSSCSKSISRRFEKKKQWAAHSIFLLLPLLIRFSLLSPQLLAPIFFNFPFIAVAFLWSVCQIVLSRFCQPARVCCNNKHFLVLPSSMQARDDASLNTHMATTLLEKPPASYISCFKSPGYQRWALE